MASPNDTIIPLSNLDTAVASKLPITLKHNSCHYSNLISSYLKTVEASRLLDARSNPLSKARALCIPQSTIPATFFNETGPSFTRPHLSYDKELKEKSQTNLTSSECRPTASKSLSSLYTSRSQSAATCLPIVLNKITSVEPETAQLADPWECCGNEKTQRHNPTVTFPIEENFIDLNEPSSPISSLGQLDLNEKIALGNSSTSPNGSLRRKERNSCFRFSAPIPRGRAIVPSPLTNEFNLNEQRSHLDPFPSPSPSRRFLRRNSHDSSFRPPHQDFLPEWVIQEYLSSINSTDNTKSLLKKNETQLHQDRFKQKNIEVRGLKVESPKTQSFTVRKIGKSRLSSTSSTSSTSKLPEKLPPPGKVFYTLLNHSQVIEFNKNDIYDFPCRSPVAIVHNCSNNKKKSKIASLKIRPKVQFRQLFSLKRKQ